MIKMKIVVMAFLAVAAFVSCGENKESRETGKTDTPTVKKDTAAKKK